MAYKNILYEEGAGVAKITFNRPEVLNAVDMATVAELRDLLSQVERDPQIRVILFTGSGEKSFIVGADKEEIKKRGKEAESFETACRETLNLIENMGKPTICAINGYAFGLGLQVALACTFRIVSSNAKMGLPEVNFGFFPSMGATQRLTRLIGEAKAMEMILTGESIDGKEAFRIGLAHKEVSPDGLGDNAEKLAEKLAGKSPVAIKLAMEAIKYEKGASMEEGLAYEAKLSELCFKSRDT
jgi:enoyl-CoA hydratase